MMASRQSPEVAISVAAAYAVPRSLHDWPQWQWQLRQRLPPCPTTTTRRAHGMRTTSTAQVLQQRVRHLIRKHADSAMLAPPPPHPLRQHHLEGHQRRRQRRPLQPHPQSRSRHIHVQASTRRQEHSSNAGGGIAHSRWSGGIQCPQ